MKKFNEIKDLYKNNRKLFNTIVLLVNIVLIFWQSIFSIISPSRSNVFLLLILIGTLLYLIIKDNS